MNILDKLAKSKFRSRFKLRIKELEYIIDKGLDKIHSYDCNSISNKIAHKNKLYLFQTKYPIPIQIHS